MRTAMIASLMAYSVAADAQVTYKCTDSARKITYSNIRCENQGLQPAGDVRDRITVLPAQSSPAPSRQRPRGEGKGAEEREPQGSGTQIKPANPLLERLPK
jgi:hypothetical protein